jgi:hypothetical protein
MYNFDVILKHGETPNDKHETLNTESFATMLNKSFYLESDFPKDEPLLTPKNIGDWIRPFGVWKALYSSTSG